MLAWPRLIESFFSYVFCRLLPSPWRIVVPALMFNFIALGFVISATTMLHNGLQRFCEQLLGKQFEMSGTGINGTTTDINVNPQHGFRTMTGYVPVHYDFF